MIDKAVALQAKSNESLRGKLLAEEQLFICRCASYAAGIKVDRHMDIYSVAMIAFNDAISFYDPQKGSFDAFASKVIKNRVVDYLRSEKYTGNVIPFSSICRVDKEGNELPFDIEDSSASVTDEAFEIEALKSELSRFDISFFELPDYSPKSRKTKLACIQAVKYIVGNKRLFDYVYSKKRLPSKEIKSEIYVNEKVLERYRKYIIAGVIICAGEYGIIKQYFLGGEEE